MPSANERSLSQISKPMMRLGQVGTVSDIAEVLGVTETYIYKCLQDGLIDAEPVAQFGNTRLYEKKEFEAWQKARRLAATKRRANHQYKGLI